MDNVIKLRGIPQVYPDQFFQVDTGDFGHWYFDLDTFKIEPSKAELAYAGKETARLYESGDLLYVRVKVQACISDKGLGITTCKLWVKPHEFESREYATWPLVNETMRGAVSESMEWLANTLGLLSLRDARDSVERAVGLR